MNPRQLENEIKILEEELNRKRVELNTIKRKQNERRIKREMSESMQIEQVNYIVNSIRNLFIDEDDDEVELCIVCYTNFPNITFYPCGHDKFCEGCYMRLENRRCPYCRTPIDSTDSDIINHGNNINHNNEIDDEFWEDRPVPHINILLDNHNNEIDDEVEIDNEFWEDRPVPHINILLDSF